MNPFPTHLSALKSRIRTMLLFAFAAVLPLAAQTPVAQTATLPGHVIRSLANATLLSHTREMDEEQIKLTIVLGLSDPAGAAAFKQDFEDSNSANFHKTVRPSEYTSRFGPTQEAYDSVLRYLERNGLTLVLGSDNRRTITVQGTRAQAQNAFQVAIDNYRLGSRTFHAVASDPALPANIAPLVVSVFGLSNLAQLHPASAPKAYTPMVASVAYNGALTAAGKTDTKGLPPGLDGSGQSIGLLEFDGFDFSDVKDWLNWAHLPKKLIDHLTNVPIEGGQSPSGCTQTQSGCGTTEAMLDIEAAMGVAQGANVVVYTASSGTDLAEALNYAGNEMINYHPGALSSSWYECEGDISASDATGIDSIVYDDEVFGVTVFNATNDHGANCVNGSNTYPNQVAFPADAANVVAVGGTTLFTNPDGSYNTESWWQNAGGFGVSEYVAKPSYQSKHAPKAGGRSVPDVAMESAPGLVVCQAEPGLSPDCGVPPTPGGTWVIQGTSLATPLFAAVWTIANQALEDSTGYIQSAGGGYLYKFAKEFHEASTFVGPGNDFAHVGLGSPNITRLISHMVHPSIATYSPYNGPGAGGTKITIKGAGFVGVEKVTFGGVEGKNLHIDSDTQLTIETPEAPGEEATIKVETYGGTATAAGPYTYNPEIKDIKPSSGPLEGGATVTITGRALSTSEFFQFGLGAATKVKCPSSTTCTMLTPPNAPGTVNVQVTTAWGYGYSPITEASEYQYDGLEITGFTPKIGPTSGGLTIAVSGHSFEDGKTKFSFGGEDATGVHCPSPDSCYMTSPAHAATGPFPVSVTLGSTPSAIAKDKFTFDVFPTVTGITPAKGPAGTLVTFTGSGFSTTAGQTTFNFFGTNVAGNCSSQTQCTAIAVGDPDGSAVSTDVPVTVGRNTSLDWVVFSLPGKPIWPKCKPGTCN